MKASPSLFMHTRSAQSVNDVIGQIWLQEKDRQFIRRQRSNQWRSQPDDSVRLCKYCHVYKLSTQSISKEMNNDNESKFA